MAGRKYSNTAPRVINKKTGKVSSKATQGIQRKTSEYAHYKFYEDSDSRDQQAVVTRRINNLDEPMTGDGKAESLRRAARTARTVGNTQRLRKAEKSIGKK